MTISQKRNAELLETYLEPLARQIDPDIHSLILYAQPSRAGHDIYLVETDSYGHKTMHHMRDNTTEALLMAFAQMMYSRPTDEEDRYYGNC